MSNTTSAASPPVTGWTIGQLAEQAGQTPDTLRYYERIGVLPKPARSTGSHRRYGADALDRLQFIQGCQRLGLKLSEITDLLAVRDTGACACEPAAPMLRRRVDDLDAELSRLTDLRTQLVAMAEALPDADCPNPAPGTWAPGA